MISGIDTSLARDHISKYDNSDPKTIFKLGILSAHAYAYVASKISDPSKSIEGMIDVVRYGLLGFDNFKNAKGESISFEIQNKTIGQRSYNIVVDRIIDIMPIDLLIELGGKIIEMSKLTEQEIKN